MSEPMTTRGPFHENGWTLKWMLQSGAGSTWDPAIRLVVPDGAGHAQTVQLSAEEAATLRDQLDAHLENIKPRVVPAPDQRERNLKAIQEETARPLILKRDREAIERAARDVAETWSNEGSLPGQHRRQVTKVWEAWPALAEALNRLGRVLP